jgi:ABC-type lipoprotein release transport system permease subunit
VIHVSRVQATSASESSRIHFWGHVTDAVTGQPLHDVTIDVWELRPSLGHSQIFYIQMAQVSTEYNGSYQVAFDGQLTAFYRVYAYYDDPSTPGYDYLLTFHESTQTEANIDFHLVPAASILLETAAVMFVDASDPPLFYDFIVLPHEEFPYDAVLEYGENYHSPLSDINANHIIVPANSSLQIEVKAWGPYTRTGLDVHSVILGVPDFFVHKGELIHVNVMQYSTPINVNITKTALNRTETHLTEAEEKGLYATAERQYLKAVHALIQSAEEKLAQGSYHDSYVDIREAYLKILTIDSTVQNAYTDAATSVYIIILFLAFTATASAHIVLEHRNTQRLASGIIYLIFFLIFHHVYYGSQIVELPLLIAIAAGSLLASESLAFIMPRVFPQTIAVTFAMAKRSLLRRKIRFILTLIPIIVLVMGFVALTSFTTEHGFVSKTVATAATGSNSLLVKGPLPHTFSLVDYNATDGVASTVATFTALTPSDVEWLNRTPEVTVVAPLVENIASRYPLGSISTATTRVSLYGVLGLSSNEPAISDFDRLVVDGRFLQEAEDDAVLISVQAAAALNVAVGDRLSLSAGSSFIEVTLVGLLDDSELGQLTDSDGAPIVPEKIVVVKDTAGFVLEKRIALCESSEVVVLDWRTALELSSLFAVSRMGVVLGDVVNPLPFARQLALTRDFWVWSVADERVTFFGSIAYFEAKGLSIFVPWVIAILTIVMTMINVIYERRNEVAVLSSVGLNPTHITAIFGAEALMIGVIGGGMGYLLGQSAYKLTSFLALDILVEQKVSAVWSFASLGIAITAVIVGAFLALKTSTIITPSLLRRWSVERGGHFAGEPWILDIPFKVNEEDLHAMTEHVIARFRRHLQSLGIDEATTAITVRDDDQDGASRRTIAFETLLGDRSKVGALPFQLVATRGDEDDAYVLHVACKGPEDVFKETVRFLRTTIIEWSTTKERTLR